MLYQSHQHAHHKSDTQAQINKTYVLPNPHQTTSQIRNVVEYDVPGPTLKPPIHRASTEQEPEAQAFEGIRKDRIALRSVDSDD